MKKIGFVISFFLIFSIMGCVTTSTSSSTFSSTAKEKVGEMIISTDEFEGTKTVSHKGNALTFTGNLSTSLYFEPYFIYNDVAVSCFLRIKSLNWGREANACKKIILLGDASKVTINVSNSPDVNIDLTNAMLGKHYIASVSEKISKSDYEKLLEFIANNSKIRLGYYTINDKAEELREDGNKAHKIFGDAYDFYNQNLKSKVDNSQNANPLIWQ